jgi:hypothetical protein
VAKGGYFEESQIEKIKIHIFTLFWFLHDSICVIVLMSSLLFYNVENSKELRPTIADRCIKSSTQPCNLHS